MKNKDLEKEDYKLLKKLIIRENLKNLVGKYVKVYIDRPLGSIHPKHNDIIYPINYGYIKEITAVDNEYQDVLDGSSQVVYRYIPSHIYLLNFLSFL